MTAPLDEASRIETELLVLRALCQGTPQGSARAQAIRTLKDYRWREPVHQAMFSCLTHLPAGDPNFLPIRQLTDCLTRKGFPDVELKMWFEPPPPSRHEAEKLMRRLIAP